MATARGLAGIIGQKQGIRGAGGFAALVADGGPAIFGRGVAAIELDAGQVQGPVMQPQHVEPKLFPGTLLAPFVEVIIHALPGQWAGGQQLLHGQPAPLTTGFELVENGPDDFLRLGRPPPAVRTKRQMGEYPGGNDIFGQDFHEGEKGDGSHLKFRSAVGVFCVLGLHHYFLNSFRITEASIGFYHQFYHQ